MGELAAGRKEIHVRCTAALSKAAIAPPDDTEGQCRTQREFPAAAFERLGPVEWRNKCESDCTFLLNIGRERDILLFLIWEIQAAPIGFPEAALELHA